MNLRERWSVIEGFSRYEISDLGRVRNIETGRILKSGNNGRGYRYIPLKADDNIKRNCYIHRLVMFSFLNGSQEDEVNHKNGNKSDNTVSNLEIATRHANIQHAYRTGLNRPSFRHNVYPVMIIETGDVYESAAACARAIGGRQSSIQKIVNGIGHSHLGYTFKYVEDRNAIQ